MKPGIERALPKQQSVVLTGGPVLLGEGFPKVVVEGNRLLEQGGTTMVRAKFTVSQVTRNFYGGKEQLGVTIKLTPQYDSSIEEDRRYAKATPSGEITLHVDNPPAAEALVEGQTFYVDFTPVPR